MRLGKKTQDSDEKDALFGLDAQITISFLFSGSPLFSSFTFSGHIIIAAKYVWRQNRINASNSMLTFITCADSYSRVYLKNDLIKS
jgi:hypothetical protein